MPIAKEGRLMLWPVRGRSSVVIRPHISVIATVLPADALGVVLRQGKND